MKTASEIHSNAVFLWSSVLFDAVLGLSAVFAVLASPPRLPEGSLWVLGALSCALALIVPAWSFSRAEKGRLERSIESNRLIANAGTAISIIFLVLLSGLVSGAAVASGALKIDGAIVF